MEVQDKLVRYKQGLFLIGGMVAAIGAYLIFTGGRGTICLFPGSAGSATGVMRTASSTQSTTGEQTTVPVYLGVEIMNIDKILAENLDLKGKTGVFVVNVMPHSPADKGGLKRRDVIAAFNNRDTIDVENFKKLLSESRPGDTVRIVYVRDGKKATAYVTLIAASAIKKTANTTDATVAATSPASWGVTLSALTDQLRAEYNIPACINGVIILAVTPGGIADTDGLEAGNVITGIGQTAVTDMESLLAAAAKDTDGIILLSVYANGTVRYVPISSSSLPSTTGKSTAPTMPDAVPTVDISIAVPNTPVDPNFQGIGWYGLFVNQFIPLVAVVGLVFAWIVYQSVLVYPTGNMTMRLVADKIRSGAMVFLRREYRVILIVMLSVFFILFVFLGIVTALSFMLGGSISLLVGYIGIKSVTAANVRACQGAKDEGLWRSLSIAFRGGTVLGISIAALGIAGIAIVGWFMRGNTSHLSAISIGFALGASTVALFARIGGGIFTKSADVGADMVGKIELGIPEDDHRNPGVIADNIGDCVGDTAGMGADLFESYTGSIIATMAIGLATSTCVACIYLPLLVAAVGLLSSMLAIMSIKLLNKKMSPKNVMRYVCNAVNILFVAGSFIVVKMLFGSLGHFWALMAGIACGFFVTIETEHFTSGSPVNSIARASESGSALTIITGFAVGLKSAILPIVTICATVFLASTVDGLYGVALSAVGMLSTIGVIMSIDAFGPIADTAGGIAQLSGLSEDIRDITDELDSLGNTTAAIGKGFAIGSAAMTAFAFFSAYLTLVGLKWLDLASMDTSTGLLIGAVVPFGIAALTIDSVGKVAKKMVEEIRRQFRSIKGLLQGKAEPDVDRCIDIVTAGALRELVVPGIIAIGSPLLIGIILGRNALGGFLFGATATGMILGLFMANAGAAWDNAKKLIESGLHGGAGSSAHKASVVGDTVGDPLKDTAGPSMNILIKLMALVALVFAGFFFK